MFIVLHILLLKGIMMRTIGKLIHLCTYVLQDLLPVRVWHTLLFVRVPCIIQQLPLALLLLPQINGWPMYRIIHSPCALAVDLSVVVGLCVFLLPVHMRCWCCPLVHCCSFFSFFRPQDGKEDLGPHAYTTRNSSYSFHARVRGDLSVFIWLVFPYERGSA